MYKKIHYICTASNLVFHMKAGTAIFNFILLICVMMILMSARCTNERKTQTTDPNNSEKIEYSGEGAFLYLEKIKHDFGRVKKRRIKNIPITFKVENKGSNPLVILKVDVSCGCLSADFFRKPILPGEKSEINIHVDLTSQEGYFNKTVFIKSNAENDVALLRIIGEVKQEH